PVLKREGGREGSRGDLPERLKEQEPEGGEGVVRHRREEEKAARRGQDQLHQEMRQGRDRRVIAAPGRRRPYRLGWSQPSIDPRLSGLLHLQRNLQQKFPAMVVALPGPSSAFSGEPGHPPIDAGCICSGFAASRYPLLPLGGVANY